MPHENEHLIDFHQTSLHLLKGETDKATQIIVDYVNILAKHPDKQNMPIFQKVKTILLHFPKGFVEYDTFKKLINGLIKAVETGSINNFTHHFN